MRINNDLFFSRGRKESQTAFVAQKTHEGRLCVLCFDCLLIFATPSPKSPTLFKRFKP